MNKNIYKSHQRNSGFALIIVLSILALLVAMILGFFIVATNERSLASGYSSSITARQMADIAVSLVQGQINIATTKGPDVAWSSQPGMIRTYGINGNLSKAYKLYSSSSMIVDKVGIVFGISPDQATSAWGKNPATWVDLNAPIEVNGIKNFPILDPNSKPDGFALSSVPGSTSYQPIPMPVRWLYVLKNGSLANPINNADGVRINEETKDNPIVGRIAFWTDDDSCKININTASDGTFWDVPRALNTEERELGKYQPAQNEFQRYPGHPATTSLKAVFPDLSSKEIFDLVPRVFFGGSKSGTIAPQGPVTLDSDRLYTSIDELLFKPNRNENSGLSKTQLERAKFFITAHSRAPETNLFNLPRIACWPVFKDLKEGRVTAFDKLIAFCASTGVAGDLKPYYFQREDAASPVNDISISRNVELYEYLQYLTGRPIPGFGGNFSSKYEKDRDQILTEIFDYIRSTNLHDDLLAAGNRFTTSWNSSSTKTIPTGHGSVAPSFDSSSATMGVGRTVTLSEFGLVFICNAVADDPSTSPDESHGSNTITNSVLGGSPLSAGEKYIQAASILEFFAPMVGYVTLCPNIQVEISGLNSLKITSAYKGNTVTKNIFPTISETASYSYVNPSAYHTRLWGGKFNWRYFALGKGSPSRGNLAGDKVGNNGVNAIYPFIGVPMKIPAAPSGGTMQFSGGDLEVKIYSGAAAALTPSNLIQTIKIKMPAETFPIPNLVDISVPSSTTKENWWAFSAEGAIGSKRGRFYYSTKNPGSSGISNARSGALILEGYDVVRTMLPSHGDYRLVAASHVVENDVFVKHRFYSDTSKMIASNLTNAATTRADQGFDRGGKYIKSLTYDNGQIPDIPANAPIDKTPEISGDYDNGIGASHDGAFTNKPDEGAIAGPTGGSAYFSHLIHNIGGTTRFSPNRQVPSPVMFGSLPTGVKTGQPWRTLLFRPQDGHFGGDEAPKDHLLLDLFWMPVVEPYAISDRFSTSGKININYQILPFTYIERSTGLHALLNSEKITAFPNSSVKEYKKSGAPDDKYRRGIDLDETLKQFANKFNSGSIFISASEICDMHIIPSGQTAAEMKNFWKVNALTGDNTREKIYATIYPRVTTRSNTFTVHFWAQALKKTSASKVGVWSENVDIVAGEYRGSTTLERFIDANNPNIPDYAKNSSNISSMNTLDTFYKWRIISNKQFAP